MGLPGSLPQAATWTRPPPASTLRVGLVESLGGLGVRQDLTEFVHPVLSQRTDLFVPRKDLLDQVANALPQFTRFRRVRIPFAYRLDKPVPVSLGCDEPVPVSGMRGIEHLFREREGTPVGLDDLFLRHDVYTRP